MSDVVPRPGVVVVSGVASDSHTWNLVFLQLLLEELGYEVVNLGPCVPDDVLVEECERLAPVMVVLSSVNGHGHQDGARSVRRLRASQQLVGLPIAIGGKLGIHEKDNAAHVRKLLDAGFDAVFADGDERVVDFQRFVRALPGGAPGPAVDGGVPEPAVDGGVPR
ncbi:cobalamin B12-binding domain-containing protein [Actinomadura rudentiformis]|uniref:Methylaspartate mutase n=1 Tax=Actinomadura rudentiformis TaxID=359158 RepID=A0A6H9YI26_9ACTN|nr:cobalamin-dependent protein [Actinomadura rudentiformis]KAB2346141.1 methylaspartate mutase [Actinomadura rudentiformis]